MQIKRVEMMPNASILIETDSNLSLKLLVSGVGVSRENTVKLKKSKLMTDFIDPLKSNGISVDQIIETSFKQLSYDYSLNQSEIEGWGFLFSKIEVVSTQLKCAKFLNSVLLRSLNMNPNCKDIIISLIKKFRTVAKKNEDTIFAEHLTQDLKSLTV